MSRHFLFVALTATLALAGCGSKGPLVLPPRPQDTAAKPAATVPPVQTAPNQNDVSTPPTPTR